jgi:5-methylcytosine-specific restriction endonuclease McrA
MNPLPNKYTKYYNQLVESRKLMNRTFQTGFEKHHIIPKSLGGNDTKSNLVVFTPREHCLAHLLLAKMFSGTSKAKMIMALNALMKLRNSNRNVLNSREYENLRKAHYKAIMDPDFRAYRSELAKKQWTPERRAQVAEKTRQQWVTGPKREIYASDEYRTKKSNQMKERWKDPTYIQEQSNKAKIQWSDGGSLRNR